VHARVTPRVPSGFSNGDTRCSATIDDAFELSDTAYSNGRLIDSSAARWNKIMALRKRDRAEERLPTINKRIIPSGPEDKRDQTGQGRKDTNAEDGEDENIQSNTFPGAEEDVGNCKFLILYSNAITKLILF
jgi:hypothetical protein